MALMTSCQFTRTSKLREGAAERPEPSVSGSMSSPTGAIRSRGGKICRGVSHDGEVFVNVSRRVLVCLFSFVFSSCSLSLKKIIIIPSALEFAPPAPCRLHTTRPEVPL